MKGLVISLLLLLVLCGLILLDAFLVSRAINDIEAALANVSAPEEAIAATETIRNVLQRKHFLLAISLPLELLEEAEAQALALSHAVKNEQSAEVQKEKEALSLCLSRMRRGVLPTWSELL